MLVSVQMFGQGTQGNSMFLDINKDFENKLIQADRLYEAEDFAAAAAAYVEADAIDSTNSTVKYKIGYCYLFSGKYVESLPYLEKAYQMNSTVAEDINFLLGQSYQLNCKFDKALVSYKADLPNVQSDSVELAILNKFIEECESGLEIMKNPKNVDVTNVSSSLNTDGSEYGFFVFPDGKKSVLTTIRLYTTDNNRKSEIYTEDIMVSDLKSNKWQSSSSIGLLINTTNNEGSAGVSPSGKELYVYKYKKGGDLYVSTFSDSTWGKPKAFPKPINTKYYENSLTSTADGKTIYFISDRDSSSFGDTDIYTSQLISEGKWSLPVNLGPNINTPAKEATVFVTPDGNTLYFSSKGHNSIGGYDIFKSTKVGNSWSKAENIGYPINSADEDFSYVNYDTIAYFSSMREGGLGQSDIYKVTPKKELPKDTTEIVAVVEEIKIEGFNVSDFVVVTNINFKINEFTTTLYEENLTKLSTYLKSNTDATIQLFGYTDQQGNPTYNQGLSEKRAQFVKTKLIEKGVNEKQITVTQGKAFEKQISKNKDDKGNFIYESLPYNRRTEIIPVKQGSNQKLVVNQIEVPEKYKLAEAQSVVGTVNYSILLKQSLTKLNHNDFPIGTVELVKDGNYIYYYGKTKDLSEVTKNYDSVKSKYPEAKVFENNF